MTTTIDTETTTAPAAAKALLGPNQYGKAEVRLVRITRDTARYQIEDLSVTSQLHGNFTACHEDGDNSKVVATDTQKNTVYGFAKEVGVGAPEDFLITLSKHFTGEFDWIKGGRWAAEQYFWNRIEDHDHAFSRDKSSVRTAVVESRDGVTSVVAGVKDLTVLKSTGSEFHGFPRDRFTTLVETDDRILATDVTARWRYEDSAVAAGLDYDALYEDVTRLLLHQFADVHSLALQQTMFAMGQAVLDAHPEIAEIRMSLPNNHHFVVALEPFGLENPNEVFFAADRPYGLIEATVQREGTEGVHKIWENVAGFC
ncbi:MAG: factor-independent urate hydroxylase [Galactobacter sp.]